MPPDQLVVLRAGLPPIRGRKIAYYREGVFTRRIRRPPTVAARPPSPPATAEAPPPAEAKDPFNLTLDLIAPNLDAEGIAPLPALRLSPPRRSDWCPGSG